MGIPLRAGALLSEADRDGRTAVISASLAERAWPNQEPSGKRFQIGSPQSPVYEVVGVVGDVRGASLSGNQQFPTVYVPYWRRAFNQVTIAVKATGEPTATYALVRQTIRRLDPELPIPAMKTMPTMFAGLALILAAVGTFGVMSHVVRSRTREMGVRIALVRCDTKRHREARAGRGCSSGVGVDYRWTCGGDALGPSIEALLYDVKPGDPSTMAAAALALTCVALVASYVPIRRMLAQNPLASLKND